MFHRNRYRYTCKSYCVEEPDVEVEDGAVKIFLNTRGMNPEGVSQELIDFLHYVEHSTEENCMITASERIRRIHESVKTIKTRKDMGVRYMQAWEEKYYIREEGLEEGILLTKHVIKMDSIGKTIPEIAKECGVTEEIVKKILKE